MQTACIIGGGEIGSAIKKVLGGDIHDPDIGEEQTGHYDIMHVCIPYSDKFDEIVWGYQVQFSPKYTIIHSTVKPGTSRRLGAIHSPVIGIHPNLEPGIRTFVKYLSGPNASEVAHIFRRAGLKVQIFDDQETTELGKIAQTTFYALMIEFVKDLKRECDKQGLSYSEVYTLFAQNYNEGYKKLDHPEFCMPLLVPIMTKQGGHCTIPNLEMWETNFTKFIKGQNSL